MTEENLEDTFGSELGDVGYVGKGQFNSPFSEYPGYIRLPDPFTDSHYKAWLRATREDVADDVDNLTAFKEWRGALALLREWAVEGVSRSELEDESTRPSKLAAWVRTCVTLFIIEQFDPKAWRGGSET